MKRFLWIGVCVFFLAAPALAADRYVCIYPNGYDYGGAGYTYSAGYTSMLLMEAGEDGTFDANDLYVDILHGSGANVWNGNPETSGSINFDGWDFQNGHKMIIRTMTAAMDQLNISSRPDYSNGTWDTTEYILQDDDSHCIMLDNDHDNTEFLEIEFVGIQLEQIGATKRLVLLNDPAYTTAVTLEKCWGLANADKDGVLHVDTSGVTLTIVNCVWDGDGGTGDDAININAANTNVYLHNNTVFGWNNQGIVQAAGTVTATNNIVANNGADFTGTLSGNLNASDDQDGPGTDIGPSGADWDNEIGTAWTDLRALNSGNIYLAGEIQDNDARVPNDDIIGTTRPQGANPPTIGAFEFVAAGGGIFWPHQIFDD